MQAGQPRVLHPKMMVCMLGDTQYVGEVCVVTGTTKQFSFSL